jgi:hypothetical protein
MARGLAPVLVMLAVGSLMWFLAEVLYGGENRAMVRWTLGWFVLACVLVSRISIEVSRERAALHALALAGVTALWIIRYIEPPWIPLALLGLIWWCASKLVWDCTVIDDAEDTSGQGLLDAAGVGRRIQANPTSGDVGGGTADFRATYPLSVPGITARRLASSRTDPARRPGGHAPGRWVVYFSLGALPLFGIGQLLLPPASDSRQTGFHLLWVYLAAALGLLLVTSFLGLRRYLRQRSLLMPLGITVSWLTWGLCIGLVALSGAVLLPRPDASYSLPALAERLGTRLQAADAPAKQTTTTQDARAGAEKDGKATRSAEASQPGNGSAAETGHNSSGKQAPAQSDRRATSPAMRPWASLGVLLRWLVYAALGLIGLIWLLRHAPAVWAGLRELWTDLWRWLNPRLPGHVNLSQARQPAARRRFDSYRDPFHDAAGTRQAPGELLCYTFEALQAWAAEWGWARRPEETPLEFGDRLAHEHPPAPPAIKATMAGFCQLAYAHRPPDDACLREVRQLWITMSQGRR